MRKPWTGVENATDEQLHRLKRELGPDEPLYTPVRMELGKRRTLAKLAAKTKKQTRARDH